MALRRSCHPTQLASPPAARAAAQLSALPVAQQCTQMPRNGSVRPFRRSVYTIVSPRAARATPASQQCTQMPQNSSERPFSAICVHYCVTTGRPRESRVATVYTNGPERRRKTVFGDLCTLLRHHRPPARVPRCDSVHKWLRTASKDRFRQSVYTIASPRGARATPAPQQCTQMPLNGSERPFSAICVHYCVTTGRPRDPRASTVYTNAPERRREAVFGDLCTLLRPPCVTRGRPRDPRASTVYTNAPERLRRDVFGDLCTLLCPHRPPA